MSDLSTELSRYLRVRRSLGYDLSTTERVLRKFVDFAKQNDAEHISVMLFLQWQESFGHANRQTWSRRLGIVRLFAQWLQCLDPKHEVPPRGLIPDRMCRSRPYIYSDEEIRRIVSDRGGAAFEQRHPGIDLLDSVRSHRYYRTEDQRSHLPQRRGCRSGDRVGYAAARKVWKEPSAADLGQHQRPD